MEDFCMVKESFKSFKGLQRSLTQKMDAKICQKKISMALMWTRPSSFTMNLYLPPMLTKCQILKIKNTHPQLNTYWLNNQKFNTLMQKMTTNVLIATMSYTALPHHNALLATGMTLNSFNLKQFKGLSLWISQKT